MGPFLLVHVLLSSTETEACGTPDAGATVFAVVSLFLSFVAVGVQAVENTHDAQVVYGIIPTDDQTTKKFMSATPPPALPTLQHYAHGHDRRFACGSSGRLPAEYLWPRVVDAPRLLLQAAHALGGVGGGPELSTARDQSRELCGGYKLPDS